jgi:hypothetical protein
MRLFAFTRPQPQSEPTAHGLMCSAANRRALQALAPSEHLNPIDPRRYIVGSAWVGALFFLGRFEEAAARGTLTLSKIERHVTTIRFTAGDTERAKSLIKRLVTFQPDCNMRWMRRVFRYRYSWMEDAIFGALQTAGLPE